MIDEYKRKSAPGKSSKQRARRGAHINMRCALSRATERLGKGEITYLEQYEGNKE